MNENQRHEMQILKFNRAIDDLHLDGSLPSLSSSYVPIQSLIPEDCQFSALFDRSLFDTNSKIKTNRLTLLIKVYTSFSVAFAKVGIYIIMFTFESIKTSVKNLYVAYPLLSFFVSNPLL